MFACHANPGGLALPPVAGVVACGCLSGLARAATNFRRLPSARPGSGIRCPLWLDPAAAPLMTWHDIAPADAVGIDCTRAPWRELLDPPLSEHGQPCPWPWHPQTRHPRGFEPYACPYCASPVVAGVEHPSYGLGRVTGR